MRARDEVAKATLRSVITAISKAEVSGKQQSTLTDDQVIGVIRSELGKRKEAAEIYDKAGRDELASRERSEAGILTSTSRRDRRRCAGERLSSKRWRIPGLPGSKDPARWGPSSRRCGSGWAATAEGGRIAQVVKSALAP